MRQVYNYRFNAGNNVPNAASPARDDRTLLGVDRALRRSMPKQMRLQRQINIARRSGRSTFKAAIKARP